MHVADDRIGVEHTLAVEAHDQAQRAVGGRVLRAEVEDHVAGVELDVDLRGGEVLERAGIELDLGEVGGAHAAAPFCSGLSAASAAAGAAFVAFVFRHRLDVDEAGPRLHHA